MTAIPTSDYDDSSDLEVPAEVVAALDRLGRLANVGALSESRTSSSAPRSQTAEETVGYLTRHVEGLYRQLAGLRAPLKFKYTPGLPLLIVKMGSDSKGWIPNKKHFDHVQKTMKAAAMDDKFNILLMHYAISTETIGG